MSSFIYHKEVSFAETDCNGVVYHPQYLTYCEQARFAWFRAAGVGFKDLMKEGVYFLIRHVSLQYLRPAYLEDSLAIHCSIAKWGKASLIFQHQIMCGDKQICEGQVEVLTANQNYRPIPLPQSVLQLRECATDS